MVGSNQLLFSVKINFSATKKVKLMWICYVINVNRKYLGYPADRTYTKMHYILVTFKNHMTNVCRRYV